jgi:hypothetical protein
MLFSELYSLNCSEENFISLAMKGTRDSPPRKNESLDGFAVIYITRTLTFFNESMENENLGH